VRVPQSIAPAAGAPPDATRRAFVSVRSAWTMTWKIGAFLVLWGILLAPCLVPLAGRLERWQKEAPLQARLYFDVISAVTVVAAAWVMARFADRRTLASLGFAPQHLARDLALGSGVGAAWLLLSVALAWLGGWARPLPASAISFSALAWMGAALAFNTLAQEALARGYVLQTLQSHAGELGALILSSFLFMAYHAGAYQGSWLAALNVFAAGLLFGLAYYLTGNLWMPIGIHFAWNFLLGPVLGLSVSGQDPYNAGTQLFTVEGPRRFTGGSFGLEGGAVVTLTTAIGILALALAWRRKRLAAEGGR
jgi:membrane protease YdiL (CAAX protease family)